MISIREAQRIILNQVVALPVEEVSLLQGLGRIIAEDVRAPWDLPPADNSAMDGYALSSASPERERWSVTDLIAAGHARTAPVAPGEAVKIMTGAPVPPGCDRVVPIEDVERTADGIRLLRTVKAGSHIRWRGEDVRSGELVVAAGSAIRPQEVGMLASLGKIAVRVRRKARVAILATGDELLDIGAVPDNGKIINSNSYSLAAQVIEAGGEPLLLGIARDTETATREKIREGLQADMLITTGGVSVGDRDFVKDSLREIGGEILFWKVNMKPGKPIAFAALADKPVFALPGNPVAAMVCFDMFVRPALQQMMGHSRIFRPTIRGTLTQPAGNKGDRPHFLRVQVTLEQGRYKITTVRGQSSGNLASLTGGNGLLKLEPNTTAAAGSEVEVVLLDRGFEMDDASAVLA